MTDSMSKGDIRRQRQAEHAAREQARLAVGDTRTAAQRAMDAQLASARRRKPRKARAAFSTQQWAEERGGLIGGYETDDTYCPD